MLQNKDNRHNWPVQADVFCYPSRRLSSRHPIWSSLSSVDMNSQWKEDWQSASVTNCAIVEDPTSRQPGFDLLYLVVHGHCWTVSSHAMQSLHVQVGADKVINLLTWRPYHGQYRELLSADWMRSDDSTWSWRRCCQRVEFCGDYSTREIKQL